MEINSPLRDVTFFVSKATRPAPIIDSIVIHNGQDEISRPGKHRWKPVVLSFYEAVYDPSNTDAPVSILHDWWAKSMINVRASIHNIPDNYLSSMAIYLLNGVGNIIWSYGLYGCWPSDISPSDLSYADSTISEIAVTISYNKAIENHLL